jgi:glyoxylase-like metal-dependent hydrolase (beta-lactamase superfamily II)
MSHVQEVAPGVWRVTTPLPFRPREVHAYLVVASRGWWLVDGGARTEGAWEALDAGVRNVGLSWSTLRAQLVTHMHLDHLGLSGRVREASPGAPLLLGALDAARVSAARRSPGEEEAWRVTLFRSHGAPGEVLAASGTPAALASPLEADHVLTGEGGRLGFDPAWTFVWTPGHTAGHVAVVRRSDGVVICGDAVLPRISPTIGVNRQREDPVADYLGTLRRLSALAPVLLLPGHGVPVDRPGDRIRELETATRAESQRILGLLRAESGSAWTLTVRRYEGRELPPGPLIQGFRETIAHLEHLVRSGYARREGSADGSVRYRVAGPDQ